MHAKLNYLRIRTADADAARRRATAEGFPHISKDGIA